jgi:multicomponent Na+:H+ antiporter subunit C
MLTSDNYFRKIIGLSLFQNAVLLFYIALGKAKAGIVPIEIGEKIYSSPLPHVLMLTAIVVGFATLSVGLALIKCIKDQFSSLSEDEINQDNH